MEEIEIKLEDYYCILMDNDEYEDCHFNVYLDVTYEITKEYYPVAMRGDIIDEDHNEEVHCYSVKLLNKGSIKKLGQKFFDECQENLNNRVYDEQISEIIHTKLNLR